MPPTSMAQTGSVPPVPFDVPLMNASAMSTGPAM